jgi:Xaa-Pro dipeptidase
MTKHLHFGKAEFARRQRAVRASMARLGLDGLLLFKQESMYWLSGYDTSGYVMFQAMYFGLDGRMALLTRSPDVRQAEVTSTIPDIRMWVDRQDARPGRDVRDLLADYGCRGKRIGVEYHAYGLTGQRAKMVDGALAGFCRTEDASDVVRLIRVVKSPAELAYVRRAGALADAALALGNRMAVPGADIGRIYGEVNTAIMAGGGDPSSDRWPMTCGANADLVRYHTKHGVVGPNDQVTFELAAPFRHYHAVVMNVALTGTADHRQRDNFRCCVEALEGTQSFLKPGRTCGEVYDAHARAFRRAGFKGRILNACGYSVGATFPPSWMEWPMCWRGNTEVLRAGMTLFTHMIAVDERGGRAVSIGETAIITERGFERATHAPRELVVN